MEEVYYLRDIIGKCMLEMREISEKVVIVNADLAGTCRTKAFSENYPQYAFNVGIAEQNMVSFAAGLAHEGFIPFVFSMAPFISMRACEQCRTDVAYSNAEVRLMATYAGCSGGISGATHWGIEDVAIMNSIPNMTVLELSDPVQANTLVKKTLEYKGPIYIRYAVSGVSSIYQNSEHFEIGKAKVCKEGNDGAFVCSGNIVQYAIEASDRILKNTGKHIRVVDAYSIKPIDRDEIKRALKTGKVIVAQDHNIIGGLGDIVARIATEEKQLADLKILGIPDRFIVAGHADYLYKVCEMDANGLENNMMLLLKNK